MTDLRMNSTPEPALPPRRRVVGLGSWLLRQWRSLTSMRTAIVLLFLLALAAIPGSLLPQRSLSPTGVASYYRDHPTMAPLLDRLGMFAVFASPWFAAVYLLLFTSLVGCLIPRCLDHARSLKAGPPPVPRHLHRLPAHLTWRAEGSVEDAADVVEQRLRAKRFRVNRRPTAQGVELSAERGRWKETGNLIFHISLLVLLLAVAGGKLWGYEGSILVTEGDGFCNSFQQYDQYRAGPLVKQQNLSPLCFDLKDFNARYEPNGTPASFTADIAVQDRPGAAKRTTRIGVNDPLRLDGDRLYVTGHGFSPTFTVTLPNGQTFGPLSAPFLPQDSRTFGSQGVVKLPDLGDGSGDGFALAGFFAPTGVVADGVLNSVDARPLNPQVAVIAYRGYLGLNSGAPQSVFKLDQRQIDLGALSKIGAANLTIGQSATLDDGTTVRFDGVKEFAALQVSHDPAQLAVLGSAILLLAGLLLNLLLRRERVFVRLSSVESHVGHRIATVGTAAGLSRGGGNDAQVRLDGLLGGLNVEANSGDDQRAETAVSAS